jgi:hypothetical protein
VMWLGGPAMGFPSHRADDVSFPRRTSAQLAFASRRALAPHHPAFFGRYANSGVVRRARCVLDVRYGPRNSSGGLVGNLVLTLSWVAAARGWLEQRVEAGNSNCGLIEAESGGIWHGLACSLRGEEGGLSHTGYVRKLVFDWTPYPIASCIY